MRSRALELIEQGRDLKLGMRERFAYYLFGYDFFISYRWSDGRTYAVRLRDALVSRGLVVFLDNSDYAKGDDWREDGRRVLRRSSRLLLVCTPDVHDSKAVLHEVEIFTRLERRILPIDIQGSLRSRQSPLANLIPPEVICFVESADALTHGPSEPIVDDVVRSFELIRQQARRFRWLTAAVVVLACALVVAIGAGIYAEGKRRDAEMRRVIAEGGRADATLNDPAQWAAGLAMATAAAVSALPAGLSMPDEVHFALLRSVWLATPYRVLLKDAKDSAAVRVTPATARILGIDRSGAVRLIDPTGDATTTLPLRDLGNARMAAISTDETLVATVTNASVRVWRVDGRPVRSIPVDPVSVTAILFTPDNKRVVTAGNDGAVLSWPIDDSDADVIQRDGARILGAAVSPAGPLIATVDDRPQVQIIDLATRQPRATLRLDPKTSRIVSIAFSPRGDRLVTASQDELVELWSAETGELLGRSGRAHVGEVTSAAFSPDGSRVVSAGFDGTLRIWTPGSGSEHTFFGHAGPVTSAYFLPDNAHVVSSSEDGTIRLWDALPIRKGPFVVIEGEMRAPCGHAVSLGGGRVATITREGRVRVFDTIRGAPLNEDRRDHTRASSASLSRDGALLVVVRDDGSAVVRNAKTNAEIATISDVDTDSAIDLSPDGQRLVIAGRDKSELRSIDGRVVLPLPHGGRTYGSTFSPDRKSVATTGADGRIRVCRVDGGCAEVNAHTVYGESVCFDSTSNRLVSGGGDRLAKVWDLSGNHRLTLVGHPDSVKSAVFSADGGYIYTVSDQDRTVRIWSSSTGSRVGQLDLPADTTAVVELPGNRLAVTVGGETWIGATGTDALLREACKILRPLDSILGVSPETIRDVHDGCQVMESADGGGDLAPSP